MWIIKMKNGYYPGQGYIPDLLQPTQYREMAKQFETRQEAKDFILAHKIEGSAIPY